MGPSTSTSTRSPLHESCQEQEMSGCAGNAHHRDDNHRHSKRTSRRSVTTRFALAELFAAVVLVAATCTTQTSSSSNFFFISGFATTTFATTQQQQQQQYHQSPSLSFTRLQARPKEGGSSTSTTATATPLMVQPKSRISTKKREEALKAMQRTKVEKALHGMDAHMLELLSDGYLYPNEASKAASTSKPRGRPEFVPGAMKADTLTKYRERQEAIAQLADGKAQLNEQEIATIAKYMEESSTKERIASSKRVRGSSQKPTESADLPDVSTTTTTSTAKKRKRVVKNLPEPRKPGAEKTLKHKLNSAIKRKRNKHNNLELQKYYSTELLTADEEYTLGMQVKFMMQCEHVHEGLSLKLMRTPTIEEWAHACGFTEADPDFRSNENDDQIRPVGYDAMFREVDPTMFVGNGLAHMAGPGRGHGRQKKTPPTQIKDFCIRVPSQKKLKDGQIDFEENVKPAERTGKLLINRGTTLSFIEMMLDSKQAKQRMVQSNMRLVISIARKYANVGVGLQDLVQEGSLGLSRAAEKFDPSKGFKFSTYASWWIQQAVFRSIAYHSRNIRLPVHIHNLLNKVRRVKTNLEASLGRVPTNEEMAAALDMAVEKYNKMLHLTKRSISLELPKYQSNPKELGQESEDLLGDYVSSSEEIEDENRPIKVVDRTLFHEDLEKMLQILDNDERRVIAYRYGLADGLTRTVTAVAALTKQSNSWVRSQECRALRKLRRPWYEKKLKEHQEALTA